MEYRIIIKNSANCEIYNKIISAKDENEAIKTVLDSEIIYAGDKIEIEEE